MGGSTDPTLSPRGRLIVLGGVIVTLALTWMPPLDREAATVVEAQGPDPENWPTDRPLLRLALMAISESGSSQNVRDLLDHLEELERNPARIIDAPSRDWDVSHALRRVLRERADLVVLGNILGRTPQPAWWGLDEHRAIVEGLAGLVPGPARDAAVSLLASEEIDWREAVRRGEDALSRGEFRDLAEMHRGEIVYEIVAAMSAVEALRAWGPASGVSADSIAALRDSLNPRLAWRAHWAYRALGGT